MLESYHQNGLAVLAATGMNELSPFTLLFPSESIIWFYDTLNREILEMEHKFAKYLKGSCMLF